MTNRILPIVVVLMPLAALMPGCDRTPSATTQKSEPPAKVESPVKESDLTKVRLAESAERRLGVTITPVERKSISLTRSFGGTIMVPQGGQIRITAPLGGTIVTRKADLPRPGLHVKKDQKLLRLAPVFAGQQEVLSPSERLSLVKAQADLAASRTEVEGLIAANGAQLQAANAQLERANNLRREGAGSEQAYETALAATRKAEADLQAARARLKVLDSIRLEMQPTSAPALDIESPLDGVVIALHVGDGLEVPASTPLLDVEATDPVWVRVPVYAGELRQIAPDQGALVRRLGSDTGDAEASAKRVQAAPVANANAGTVDLFFQLSNPQQEWSPDEKVVVRIPLKQAGDVLTVPWSAIVHDVHGGAWVYVKTAPQTYVRQRVEVREVVDGQAVLTRGPQAGASVVVAGAAELFGTEFGAGK